MGTPRQKHCALTIDDKVLLLGSFEIFERFGIRGQMMQTIRFTNS